MRIAFEINGTTAVFRRSSWTGRADLQVGHEAIRLDSPMRLSTHYKRHAQTAWQRTIGGHEVEILKVRPRVLGGVRPNQFTIRVDGNVIAEATGM